MLEPVAERKQGRHGQEIRKYSRIKFGAYPIMQLADLHDIHHQHLDMQLYPVYRLWADFVWNPMQS